MQTCVLKRSRMCLDVLLLVQRGQMLYSAIVLFARSKTGYFS